MQPLLHYWCQNVWVVFWSYLKIVNWIRICLNTECTLAYLILLKICMQTYTWVCKHCIICGALFWRHDSHHNDIRHKDTDNATLNINDKLYKIMLCRISYFYVECNIFSRYATTLNDHLLS